MKSKMATRDSYINKDKLLIPMPIFIRIKYYQRRVELREQHIIKIQSLLISIKLHKDI